MRRLGWIGVTCGLVVLGAGSLAVGIARASTTAKQNRDAARMVKEALTCEMDGEDTYRQALLDSALEKVPNYAPARWHSGHVQLHGRWVKFDEFPAAAAENVRLSLYRQIRPRYADTVQGHMELAEWCAKRKLRDQQRAHLTRVLTIDPNHQEARRRLGFRSVDGAWLTEEEARRAQQREAETARVIRRWRPKLEQIRTGLDHRSRLKRQSASERLRAIDDPDAIPAVEEVLFDHSAATSRLVIETLSEMTAHEASVSLARYAVYSPRNSIRTAAAEALRDRNIDDYVPMLLSSMSSPMEVRSELVRLSRGRMSFRHTFSRERQDHQEVVVLDARNLRVAGSPGAESLQSWAGRAILAAEDAPLTANRELALAVTQRNAVTEQLNRRIGQVLSTATGRSDSQTEERSPDEWWQWWNEHNDVLIRGGKPTTTTYRYETLALIRYDPALPEIPEGPPGSRGFECLAAGTPVWTDVGPVAIERVRVGDLVLAQDPETGCLAYKPVLQTTVRPAEDLIRIEVGGESIRSSDGHAFWVSGHGWVMARELNPFSRLHGVTGTAEVDLVEPASPEQTYNLVVADFHTFFVGQVKILSHDNTARRPTNAVVPGLLRR